MDELTIAQIQNIFGWSYPTALAFAAANGRQEGDRKQWLVPAAVIDKELAERERVIQDMRLQFRALTKTSMMLAA